MIGLLSIVLSAIAAAAAAPGFRQPGAPGLGSQFGFDRSRANVEAGRGWPAQPRVRNRRDSGTEFACFEHGGYAYLISNDIPWCGQQAETLQGAIAVEAKRSVVKIYACDICVRYTRSISSPQRQRISMKEEDEVEGFFLGGRNANWHAS